MISAAFIVAVLIEILLPFVLAYLFIRRYRTKWTLFFIGVLTFIGSQVLHIPALQGITALFQSGALPTPPVAVVPYFNAVLLGLLAGLFEETARWVGYRLLKNRGNSWGAALTLGAGHGGIESILVGVTVLAGFIGSFGMIELSPLAWYDPLAGAVERIIAISLHITLSVMVWLSVSRRNLLWFAAAVLWHALLDFVAVLTVSFGLQMWAIEGVLSLFLVANLGLLYLIHRYAQRTAAPAEPADSPPAALQEGV